MVYVKESKILEPGKPGLTSATKVLYDSEHVILNC